MNGVLIDSSVWVEYFKGNKRFLFINELINNNVVFTNDIILTELLPSILQKKEYELADLLNSIAKYDTAIDWAEIQDFQLINMKNGANNIGIVDLVIVQNCIQNNTKLLTCDKHFKIMAKYLPFETYNNLAYG
jgi:predicted nucleic acid-binding protein